MFVFPLGVQTCPLCPPCCYVSVCSKRHLHVVGGCRGPLHAGHLPHMEDASPYVLHPHSLVGFLVHLYVWGISACYTGNIPLVLGVMGVPPYVGGLWGHLHICQALVPGRNPLGVHYALSCTYFVVHYVLHIYHGYDFSHGYDGVFWSVIYFISDHCHFLDGASCNIGSA